MPNTRPSQPTDEEVEACKAVKPRYMLDDDGKSITFWPCGVKSWNPNDVRYHYCARCNRFVDDIPNEQRNPE